ncbi:MAG: MBL fold metallo-hydrolase [Bacteroidetes bacterium]|nr:MBL fold metallo-hydrolase [Bacteroidota bacterium]
MATVAEEIIKPQKAGVFRTVFLYTGQGESTLLVIPTGPNLNDYKYVLVDCDRDKEPNEIDLILMLKDLFKTSGKLEVFINTHPHNDHIGGIKEVYDEVGFDEVWHSNHRPGGEHKEKFKELEYVLKKVGKNNEYHLKGTNDDNKVRTVSDKEVIKKLGNIDFIVLSPSEYLCDEIDDASADERYRRIHEQCGVIKFTYGTNPKSILITGDSDKTAWKDHITEYHKAKLPANVLSASHHGSRTFFKTSEDDEDVYETHLENIKPTYLIVSAPRKEDSPHDHPHDDAMDLYKKYVDEDGIFHLGKTPYSVIVDIDENGSLEVTIDTELIEEYGKGDDPEDDKKIDESKSNIYIHTTKIDNKPMG